MLFISWFLGHSFIFEMFLLFHINKLWATKILLLLLLLLL